MEMIISFEDGKKVNAEYKGMTIKTDQPAKAGGESSAPEPFSLFLASIGTCAGIYVKSFCDQRDIPSSGIRLVQTMNYNPEKRLIDKISIEIQLPAGFPERYRDAIKKAADLCTVKKHLASPPEIAVQTIQDSK
ncbi:MAG: osmotically inducible protein C [Marinilabiliales bacterium]|nr:MAG: osmotically inducible protein C [Marinilabiliales bacterium]